MTTLEQTVGQMVAVKPHRAAVLERIGIDPRQLEKLTLEDACRNRGLSVTEVLAQIEKADSKADTVKDEGSTFSLTGLCDHIAAKHHAFLRCELPRLGTLLFRVTEAQGDRHPELSQILDLFGHFSSQFKRHIDIEDEVLFPMMRQLEAGQSAEEGRPGRLEMLIDDLSTEHESAEGIIRDIRMLTRDFAVPGDACDSYKLLLNQLLEFERDFQEHLGIENNILYPKACRLEQMRLASLD